MATHVHNMPAERRETGAGWIVAIIALVAVVLLFLLAGSFFNNGAGGGTNISVPESIDVNVPGAGAGGTGGAAQ